MKNQILDPMTCELQVGDVVEVIVSSSNIKRHEHAEVIKIDNFNPHFTYCLRGKDNLKSYRNRYDLRLISRNGQPINQPKKTMKTSEQLQNLAKNVASLVEAISEAADMAEYFEANDKGEIALREINKKLGDRVDDLEAQIEANGLKYQKENERLMSIIRKNYNSEKELESTKEELLNVKRLIKYQDDAYEEQIRGLNAQIAGLEEQKQIQHERNEQLLDKLKASNLLVESQRELMQIPGYVGLMMYVSEFSQKHQISTSSVWDMFFSVCKRAVFTIPEAPEPVEPPVIN